MGTYRRARHASLNPRSPFTSVITQASLPLTGTQVWLGVQSSETSGIETLSILSALTRRGTACSGQRLRMPRRWRWRVAHWRPMLIDMGINIDIARWISGYGHARLTPPVSVKQASVCVRHAAEGYARRDMGCSCTLLGIVPAGGILSVARFSESVKRSSQIFSLFNTVTVVYTGWSGFFVCTCTRIEYGRRTPMSTHPLPSSRGFRRLGFSWQLSRYSTGDE
jgi:hypothetical protein